MYDNYIVLIAETKSANEYGDIVTTTSERTVFVELKSITQTEFYQAEAVGLKPEIKFVLACYLDYQNEKILKFTPFGGNEEAYSVIRTYRTGDKLELICKRGID